MCRVLFCRAVLYKTHGHTLRYFVGLDSITRAKGSSTASCAPRCKAAISILFNEGAAEVSAVEEVLREKAEPPGLCASAMHSRAIR